MASDSKAWSRRDSWPPTQVRLNISTSKTSSSQPPPLLQDIDDSPLTYFLTPIPDNIGADIGDDGMDMEFDAGIEDTNHTRETVRSVSPSNLEGFSRRPSMTGRLASSDFDFSDGPTTDEDEDEDEEYMRFSPSSPSRLAPLSNIGIDGLKVRSRSPVPGRSAGGLLSPLPTPAPQSRGRSHVRARLGRARSVSARPRLGRLWREPSPDVWSIEEETEEDMVVGQGGDAKMKEAAVQLTAAKPKKKVRFLLPAGD